MPNYIKVSNLENKTVWEKQLNEEEVQQVKGYIKECKSTVSLISATFKPVRTNNLSNFSKDFFLPTTVNHAIKVQNTVGRIFAVLASLVLDAVTFPIRLLTCIPRVISNSKQKENPFRKYLIDEGVDKKILESDHVRVKLGWEKTNQDCYTKWTDKDGKVHTKYHQKQYWEKEPVNFIEQPTYKGSVHFASGMA